MNERDTRPGEALKSVLEPFHSAQGRQLTAVLNRDSEEGEEIILAFGTHGLVFCCDAETDTISTRFEELGEIEDAMDLTGDASWSKFIGKHFFLGWLTTSQRGIVDGALISFDGVVPEIGLNIVASEFEFLEIRQRSR